MPEFELAGTPALQVDVPPTVRAIAGREALRPVWVNGAGGITFELTGADGRRFLKWAPAGAGLDLAAEAERCRWATPHATVPAVLGQGTDATGSWLLTAAIPGESAVSERWTREPALAAAAIGAALRDLHDRLPVATCPYTWSAAERLVYAQARRDGAELIRWPEFRSLDLDAALDELAQPPPIDKLVVCHGDPCSPNTLIDDEGRWSGRVDLGALGVADRWADLAVATWSSVWNYGPGWEDTLLDAYGVAADPDRTRYYRLLWALS